MVRLFLANGFVLMVSSAFLFTIANVVVKFLSPAVVAAEIAFFRFVIGGIILLFVLVPRGVSLRGSRTSILLVRGFAGTLTFLCLLKSISLIPLANALVLFYTFPAFAAFFSFLLFREPLARGEILLIVVGVIGIYVLLGPGSHRFSTGDFFGVLAGCFAGLTIVLIRKLRETNGPLIIYFYFCLVGGIVCFPLFLQDLRMPGFGQSLLLFVLGLLFLIAELLMTQGFKFCKASEGSVILMLEVVFTAVAGVVIFSDALSPGFLAGTLLIMGSGVGLNLMHRRFRRSEVSWRR